MVFEIQEGTFADVDECGEVFAKSFSHDPIVKQLLPTASPEVKYAYWAAWFRDELKNSGEKIFKMVDADTGRKIVAFAKERHAAPPAPTPAMENDPSFPEGADAKLLLHWFDVMDTYKVKTMNPETDCFLNVLATLPEYVRLGLGSRLTDRFLAEVDEKNARAYIQASARGIGIYRRKGWNDIEDMVFDTPEGPKVWVSMMREPQNRTGRD